MELKLDRKEEIYINTYTDFEFNGVKLSSMGGRLFNTNGVITRTLKGSTKVKTIDNYNINGVYTCGSKVESFNETLNILFENEAIQEEDLKAWLYTKEPKWFNYVGDSKKIKVMFLNPIVLEIYNSKQFTLDLELTCFSGEWQSINEDKYIIDNPTVNKPYTFMNNGTEVSRPIIHIKVGEGITVTNFKIMINDKIVTLSKIVGDVYINSQYNTVYYFINSEKKNLLDTYSCSGQGAFHKYDFPNLKVGENTITILNGNANVITVEKNERYV